MDKEWPKSTDAAGRLQRLLQYLRVTLSDLSRQTNLNYSSLSRIANGHRGLTRDAKLMRRCAEVYGLEPRYWIQEKYEDPGDCLNEKLIEGDRATAKAPGSEAAEIGTWAARLGLPPEMVVTLLTNPPPTSSGALGWLKLFVELGKKHGVDLGSTSSVSESTKR